jgi:tetratricopeptide (TPR) repeat protein
VSAKPSSDSEQELAVNSHSAIGLFLEHVYKAYPDFVLSEADRAAAAQICRLLEGVPLGLKLASASARLVPLPEIAQGIQREVDRLAAAMGDLPAQQQAPRAVFEHSWQLLSQAERRAVAKLSVFCGGFDENAAACVAGVSPFLLAALVDGYFLECDSCGRYVMHELLRQFAAEKLHQMSPTDEGLSLTEREARDSHCSYYSSFLARQEERLRAREQHDAADEIAADIDNVRAAWRWAVEGLKLAEIEQSLKSLYLFYYARGWVQEGHSAFQRALAGLEGKEGRGEGIVGRLLTRLARFSWRLARHQEARELLQRSLAVWERLEAAGEPNVSGERAFRLFSLSVVLRGDGEHEHARELCQESLALYRQADNRPGVAMALKHQGIISGAMGSLEEAERQLGEALALYREIGDPYGTANTLNDLGVVAGRLGHMAQCRQMHSECLAVRRQIEDLWGVGTSLNNLGYLAYLDQEYAEAKAYLSESLAIQRQIGDRYHIANCLCNLGAAAAALGERRDALGHLYQALGIADEIEVRPLMLEALGEIGALLAVGETDEKERAVELLILVRDHTQADDGVAKRAEQSLAKLASSLGLEGSPSTLLRDGVRSVEDVVSALLNQRADPRSEQADKPGLV